MLCLKTAVSKNFLFWGGGARMFIFCQHMCATRPSPKSAESTVHLHITVPYIPTSSCRLAYPEVFRVFFSQSSYPNKIL